jgi:hypothetical protein
MYKNIRCFCQRCGSPVLNRFTLKSTGEKKIGVFPGAFDTPLRELTQDWQPVRYVVGCRRLYWHHLTYHASWWRRHMHRLEKCVMLLAVHQARALSGGIGGQSVAVFQRRVEQTLGWDALPSVRLVPMTTSPRLLRQVNCCLRIYHAAKKCNDRRYATKIASIVVVQAVA